MRIITKALLAVVALAALAPLLAAQGPPPEQEGPPGNSPWNRHRDPRFAGAAYSWFDGGMGLRPGMRGRERFGLAGLVSNPRVRERLGITPEQASKIRQEEMGFRKAQIRNRADLEMERLELAELLAADRPDRAAIDKKLRAISDTQLAVAKSRIDHRLAMREALTPEQRDKLMQMFSEFRGRGGERGFGPSGPGGSGGAGPHGPRPQSPPPAEEPDN